MSESAIVIRGSDPILAIARPQDWRGVLRVRQRAYIAAGKSPASFSAADFEDEYDASSAVIVARDGQRVIGSVRVIVAPSHHPPSYGRYFGIHAPLELPPVSKYVESSRFCVDPAYQGKGIGWLLATAMVYVASWSGRPYLVGGATGELIDFWQVVGFRLVGREYISALNNNLPHQLMLLDLDEVLRHRRVSPRFSAYLDEFSAAWSR